MGIIQGSGEVTVGDTEEGSSVAVAHELVGAMVRSGGHTRQGEGFGGTHRHTAVLQT